MNNELRVGVFVAWALTMGLGIYFLVNLSHRPKPVEPSAPADRIEKLWNRGRIVYKHNCLGCHNVNPDLPGSVGPALRGASVELIYERLDKGKGGMPALTRIKRHSVALNEYLR